MSCTIKQKEVKDLKLSEKIITDINVDFGKSFLQYIGVISLKKPKFNGKLVLTITVYKDQSCTNESKLFSISSKTNNIWEYCKAFISNNNESKWLSFTDEQIAENGLGPEFDTYPIIFNLGKYVIDNEYLTSFDVDDRLYLVYYWHDINNEHNSDKYSMIWPSITENMVSQFNTSQNNILYSSICDESNAPISDNTLEQYLINPNICTYITQKLTITDNTSIGFILEKYSESNFYKIKFSTTTDITNDKLKFYDHYDGELDLLLTESLAKNTIYLIEIQHGFVRILSSKPITP